MGLNHNIFEKSLADQIDLPIKSMMLREGNIYRPQGNIFARVCHSFSPWEGELASQRASLRHRSYDQRGLHGGGVFASRGSASGGGGLHRGRGGSASRGSLHPGRRGSVSRGSASREWVWDLHPGGGGSVSRGSASREWVGDLYPGDLHPGSGWGICIQRGVCIQRGSTSRGSASRGGSASGGGCIQRRSASRVGWADPSSQYYRIQSINGWFASYWNAFLFSQVSTGVLSGMGISDTRSLLGVGMSGESTRLPHQYMGPGLL